MSNLSPEEQKELSQLEAEEKGGWSASEDAELAALEKEFGGNEPAPAKEEGLIDGWKNALKSGTASENVHAAVDTAKSMGGDLMDRVGSFTDAYNPLTPIARVAGNAVGAALDPTKDYDQYVADDNKARAERDERTPGIYGLAGAIRNPVNGVAGVKGIATGLGVSAANQEVGALGLDSGASQQDIIDNLVTEAKFGAGAQVAGKVLAPVNKKAGELSDYLAQKYGKKSLGGTKSQLQKLEIESDDLDKTVRRLREEGVYDKGLQSSEDVYEKVNGLRKESGRKGGEIFANNAKTANQAEVYDDLMARAKTAQDRGQGEIAAKLRSEAENIKAISSKELDIDQPLMASEDQSKYVAMQNTELDPNIIKERKTTLDNEAFKSKVETNKVAEQAADSMRDMQYGLLDETSANALKAENARFGDLKTAEKLVGAKAAGDISSGGGLIQNMRRNVFTAGALGLGGAPAAAATYAADVFLSKYGNQLATSGFHKGSKVLQNEKWVKALNDAGERGGAAAISGAHFLMTQRDPEYRKAHQEDAEEQRNSK